MITPKSIRSYLKFEIDKIFKIKQILKKREKIRRKEHSAFIVSYYSVLHRMTLIGHTHSSQFMEWHNLGITTLKHAIGAPNVFFKLEENQITTNLIYLTSSNFVTISHINYWDQRIPWKNLWKFWNSSLCGNKSGPSPVLNVSVYWKNSNTEASVKKLSQIFANNIDNEGKGVDLRIYLRYCWSIIGRREGGWSNCKFWEKNPPSLFNYYKRMT